MKPNPPTLSQRSREQVLSTASSLFYQEGVRAVGMDLIVDQSGIAKTTIYRHFPTKDDLVKAFLEREDLEFWQQWEAVVAPYPTRPDMGLMALCEWIGNRISRDNYRGCPQINVAAEFADTNHPARIIAQRHKAEMVKRLHGLCIAIAPESAEMRAQQIGLIFDGAFMSFGKLQSLGASTVLKDAVCRLLQPRALF